MDKFKCEIASISRDYKSGKALITLTADWNIVQYLEKLRDKLLSCTLKLFRNHRSLDANAYCWVLLDKLASALNEEKEEIYRCYIRQMGGNNTVVCVKNEAVGELCEKWTCNGLGWQTDTLPSKLDGCTNVILYYGSSTYDTEQMSSLIDLVVQDCDALGIETKTPEELAKLKSQWGESSGQHYTE